MNKEVELQEKLKGAQCPEIVKFRLPGKHFFFWKNLRFTRLFFPTIKPFCRPFFKSFYIIPRWQISQPFQITYFNWWNPYPLIYMYLKPPKDTPFGWSYPKKAITESPQGTVIWHLPFHLPIWSLQQQQHLRPNNHRSIQKIIQQTIPISCHDFITINFLKLLKIIRVILPDLQNRY